MHRLKQLELIHKNCSSSSCKVCTGITYFNNKEYFLSNSYFYSTEEFEIVDMIIFENYIQYTESSRKNEFIQSYLIGIDLYRNRDYEKAIKYLDYASRVDNVKSAHETLAKYNKQNGNLNESSKYYDRFLKCMTTKEIKYNPNIIFEVSCNYLENLDFKNALRVSDYLDKEENWIRCYIEYKNFDINQIIGNKLNKDIINYIIKPFMVDYIEPFLIYVGTDIVYQKAFEEVLQHFEKEIKLKYEEQLIPQKLVHQPLLNLFNKGCIHIGNSYKKIKDFYRAIIWYKKAYDYSRVVGCYIKIGDKENVLKYSEIGLEYKQYEVYKKLIKFHLNEGEYDKALLFIKKSFETFQKFSELLFNLVTDGKLEVNNNISNEIKVEIFTFLEELTSRLKAINSVDNFKKIPILPEEVSPLFYLMGLIYRYGFGCDIDESLYIKYMLLGNKWNKYVCKYNTNFATDLSYYFYNDKYYEDSLDYDEDE